MFKALVNFSNTNKIHKSIIVTSFLVSVVLIFAKNFFEGLIDLFGPSSETFFDLLISPSSQALTFSIAIFIISYLINIIINISDR